MGFGSEGAVCDLVARAESDREWRVGVEEWIVFRLFASVEVVALCTLENSAVATFGAQPDSLEGGPDGFFAHTREV